MRPARTIVDRSETEAVKTGIVVMVTVDVNFAPSPRAVNVVGLNAHVAEEGRPVQLRDVKLPV